MGAYLSEPVTEKCSSEEDGEHLSYGASAMQGWRTTQEDSHNCIPNFGPNTSLFAVYDGHGGAEVAQYCSLHLPDYIKSVESFKQGNLAQALEDAFLGFDETLTRKEVISELKQLTGKYDKQPDEADENEVDHLYAEAKMPLEEVLAKYNSALNSQIALLKGPKATLSPFLKSKDKAVLKPQADDNQELNKKESDEDEKGTKEKITQPDLSNGEVEVEEKTEKEVADNSTIEKRTSTANKDKTETTTASETATTEPVSSTSSTSSNEDSLPGCSTDEPGSSSSTVRSCKYKAKASGGAGDQMDDESSSSEDETYQEIPYADSESDDQEEGEANNSGEEVDEEEEEDEEDDDDEEDEEEEDDDEEEIDLDLGHEPGSESGCTAVVGIVRGSELYVANAGDSRCVVCRNGKAIDMSVDHKPEEEVEKRRIYNAGGKVTSDGRVNGGLNLSRAIGDHTYKQNRTLSLREQMITSLPDIRTLALEPEEDEFMVLACDGIWNYMKSQEVVDFVKERIGNHSLSSICEELFDLCLAPNTEGDGTGCDNMTAIIVKFHPSLSQNRNEVGSAKRRIENGDISEQSDSKRVKEESKDD